MNYYNIQYSPIKNDLSKGISGSGQRINIKTKIIIYGKRTLKKI